MPLGMTLRNEYGNKTLYGIARDAELYTWIGYHIFVIASSLIGDTIILIASLKYRAFKLHKIITVIIEHMAVCDLMVLATLIIPSFVSLIAGKWVFGAFVGYFTYYTRAYFCLASVFFICAMTTSKVLLLKKPLYFGTKSRKDAHKICIACWIASLTFPSVFLLVDWQDIYFSYRSYHFQYLFSSNIWSYLRPLVSFIFGFLPTCIVITATVYLLVVAKKFSKRSQDKLKWQGIVTTILTGTVYCISVLPHAIYNALDSNLAVENKASSFFHTKFHRMTRIFVYFNTVSNFYIYCLTVSSFRKFLQSKIQIFPWKPSYIDISINHGKIQNLYIKSSLQHKFTNKIKHV